MGRRLSLLVAAAGLMVSASGVAVATGQTGLLLDGTPGGGCALADGFHHATVVVEHGDGTVLRRCVPFSGDRIGGEQLLHDSRIPYQTVDYGSLGKAVCQIDGEPQSYPSSCFSSGGPYWAIFVSPAGHAGAWSAASSGISGLDFGDGDAEGFRYDPQSGDPAPPASPVGTCPVATPTGSQTPGAPAISPTPVSIVLGRPPASSPTGPATAGPTPSPAMPSPTADAPAGASTPEATASASSAAPSLGTTSGIRGSSPLGPVLAGIAAACLIGLLAYRWLRRWRG